MDNRVYWIWLQNAFGPGSPKPRQIAERYGGPESFYRMGAGFWSDCSFISDREFASLSAFGPAHAEASLEYCDKLGQEVLTPDMPGYPALLKEIYNPPAALYVRGKLPESALTVTVVGTRKAGEKGRAAAREIACGLGQRGVTVVSGGALGVDSEAHRGAMLGGGKTVAVLPCGLDYPYLMDNAMLRGEIVDREGALLTELPAQSPVRQGAFQLRNRILSGLADGVLVVEAPEKSGALITAKHALEQDREVFVYIGGEGKAFAGCAALERDGAKRVSGAEEIVAAFEGRMRTERRELLSAAIASMRERERPAKAAGNKEPEKEENGAVPEGLSDGAAAVLAALGKEPVHVSVLAMKAGLSPGGVLAALTELEIRDLVAALPGQRFRRP